MRMAAVPLRAFDNAPRATVTGRAGRGGETGALDRTEKLDCQVLYVGGPPASLMNMTPAAKYLRILTAAYNRWRNAASRLASPVAAVSLSQPITGIAECCARAASGQDAAAPPIPLRDSRRLIDHLAGDEEMQEHITS